VSPSSQFPYPPQHLASRVFNVDEWGDPMAAFEEIGAQTKRALVSLLPEDWSFENRRVLDFGCGVGRTLRHFMTEAEGAEMWGADIDKPSIDWVQENLCPPLHAWRCAMAPPLGLEPGTFDLAWAVSVFTHLTMNSVPWMLELHRMLKPGGIMIASYMGRWNAEMVTGEPWSEDTTGMTVIAENPNWDTGGPAVFISDWWVREHWGRGFEILHIEPQIHNMSWAVMRKQDVKLTSEDFERPSSDPREYRAQQHALRQAQREGVALAVENRQLERAIRSEYEQSLSWRVTKPLRRVAALARALRSRERA